MISAISKPDRDLRGDHIKDEQSQAADACGINTRRCAMVRDSVILLEQLRTIDKQRLKEKICHIDGALLQEVDRALKVSLELDT